MNELERKEYFMRLALKQARLAAKKGEVPIGAVVACGDELVSTGYNMREINHDPTAHAEVIALKKAGKKLGRWNLTGCDLYVTLEPCIMCSGAIIYSRIQAVYFGAYDKRFGCCGTLDNFVTDKRFNHRALVEGGILEEACLQPIVDFFKARRKGST